ncbi:MAG: uracil-DNA glycosylase [Candidatus Aenigmatarchaeota archaeon]|nr:MAG: uracil-DNA glycosylase [Candidatus Aenigmarchaeota archaeon]
MGKEDEMKQLEKQILECKRCKLYKTKTNYVPGCGSVNAKLMLIGEAPGYWEDKQGLPFVGKAGKFLDELLTSIGLRREEVYIANILKCRPPGNRDPAPEEIKACTPYLDRQIAIIKPRIIATLGRYSMRYIFEKYGIGAGGISKIHGKVYNINTIFFKGKVVALYHPAVAVYNPNMKEVLMEDFKEIKKLLTNL